MKTTTRSRDMRALQRQLVKVNNELVQAKRNARRLRTDTIKNNALLSKKAKGSFTNDISTFNIQRKELYILKLTLREIVENQERSPYIVSKKRKTI